MGFPLRGLSYVSSHNEQFFGCSEAEVFEGKVFRKLRTVEGRIDSAVGLAVDVDVASLVDVWIALRDDGLLLVHGVLYKVIFFIICVVFWTNQGINCFRVIIKKTRE